MRLATGTYTGDGAATQAILGVGFQPQAVYIYPQVDVTVGPAFKTDQNAGGLAYLMDSPTGPDQWRWQTDEIISLDADGFTVGDGTPLARNDFNVLGRIYTYIAFG